MLAKDLIVTEVELPRDDDLARWVRRGSCVVGSGGEGIRLDAFLARRFSYRSRTGWVGLIRKGQIRLNDASARPGRALRLGDRIEYMPDPRPEPRVSTRFSVLHEDDSMLAIRKPANLPVHPSGRYYRNTLLMLLLDQRGETIDSTELRIVHRLDRETSGIILFGKGKEAAAFLARQFEHRQVRKRYLAIVHGRPDRDRFVIDARIGPDAESPVRKAMTVTDQGRPASTAFRVLRRGAEHALLVGAPRTGRLHQIRVHLRHAGLPVVGDKVYGLDPQFFLRFIRDSLSPQDRARLTWGRQALHAWKLTIRHPGKGGMMTLRAPVGRRWKDLEEMLGIGG